MRKLKVVTIVGTRPEIIKLCRVIAELEAWLIHVLVHTGQNYDYELNEIFFEQLRIKKPDHFLHAAGATAAETIGNVIAKSDVILEREQPDALLVLGDTNSALSVIVAKRRKIPIFHMEAGNRCFDARVPEEINRKIVDHTSDINLPYTEHARRYLIAEGIRPETIIKTGSPMREVLCHFRSQIEQSNILDQLELAPHKYFVVSAHREENVDAPEMLLGLVKVLNAMAEQYDMPLVVSTHPRTRSRLEATGSIQQFDRRVRLLKPLGLFDYIQLQRRSLAVVSDSGTITEESALLGFPAVMIRQTHERPEGMDEATLVMAGLNPERVLQSIDLVTAQFAADKRPLRLPDDYQSEQVSQKLIRIITSYVDYVNRNTWKK
ncbi:MAG: UDP-N-acetylglucosamine 2-epimerase (non-hydrolyzing) [Pirellulales bacterium]